MEVLHILHIISVQETIEVYCVFGDYFFDDAGSQLPLFELESGLFGLRKEEDFQMV